MKNTFGNLSEEGIEHALKNQLVGHIGCHAHDMTYVVPICYAYKDNCLYGRTYEGFKMRMIRINPKVCFQVENLESMGKWQSVICWGEFEELIDSNERRKGIEVLQNRMSAIMGDRNLLVSRHWPFSPNESDDMKGIIFCIHITKKTGMYENT